MIALTGKPLQPFPGRRQIVADVGNARWIPSYLLRGGVPFRDESEGLRRSLRIGNSLCSLSSVGLLACWAERLQPITNSDRMTGWASVRNRDGTAGKKDRPAKKSGTSGAHSNQGIRNIPATAR